MHTSMSAGKDGNIQLEKMQYINTQAMPVIKEK